jgi:hypothetical protein
MKPFFIFFNDIDILRILMSINDIDIVMDNIILPWEKVIGLKGASLGTFDSSHLARHEDL